MGLSILILTYNEEANLPACLDSIREFSDIVVLDSFSTDSTVELARERGCRVFQRKFDDFGSQRNYALDQIPFEHDWLFQLDADERFTPEFTREVLEVVRADNRSGYMVPSKLMFQGRWLKHAGMYPSYQMRLLKVGEIRFVKHGHGQRESDPKRGLGKLKEGYLHYNFSKGIEDWFAKHNRYSTEEARLALAELRDEPFYWSGAWASDSIARRRWMKQLAARLPFRPTLRFFYIYFLRLGFLDGMAGFHYARLLSTFQWMIDLKMDEFQAKEQGKTL
ncbi:glycosyltransferase family 2 protein [bacterium]|nr:glycosyltransferase family 2 protein [bacterium]